MLNAYPNYFLHTIINTLSDCCKKTVDLFANMLQTSSESAYVVNDTKRQNLNKYGYYKYYGKPIPNKS